MSEMAEDWAAFREMKQAKRRSNMAESTSRLEREGFAFTSHNHGVHLVLMKGAQAIDYWPSTGLWWIRGTRNKRRGIDRLVKFLKSGATS